MNEDDTLCGEGQRKLGTEPAVSGVHPLDSREWSNEKPEATIARLKAVLEHMPSGVAMVEATSGRLVLSNQKAAQICGTVDLPLSAARAAGRIVGRHPGGSEYERHEWPLSRAMTSGEVV